MHGQSITKHALLLAPFALLGALSAACSSAGSAKTAESESELVARARGIHERVITLDTHCDFRLSNFTDERNYTTKLNSQVDLPKMEEGGLDVAWFIVYTGQGELTDEGYAAAHEQALAKFDAIHRLTRDFAPDRIELALTSDDVRRIDAAGKKVAMIGIENAYPVGLDLDNIRKFESLGGRYMSLAHNGHSQFSDSHTGEASGEWLHGGISDLGRDAIDEMNKWGIIVDISHPSRDAVLQTIAHSKAPVIASHSSARAVDDVSRNLDDEQLALLKENGGVIQTVAFRSYVDSTKSAARREAIQELRAGAATGLGIELLDRAGVRALDEEQRAAYDESMTTLQEAIQDRMAAVDEAAPPVDVADFVDHIDYLVERIGPAHVGISSDFDGGGGVEGWNDASETFNVTLELVRRGYSEDEIGRLWSGNLLRVLDDVQRIAAEIQSRG
jgi:membrane dipeptidase